jgi:hypothetical protein
MTNASTSRVAVHVDARAQRPVRGFYVGMAIAFLVAVFAGFARSFYLRPTTTPPLAPLVVVHGIVFSGWVLLFLAQATLVAAGRTSLHRWLGAAGAGLAILMVGLGLVIAFPAAKRGSLPGDPIAFLLVILVDLLLFAVFVAAAIHQRRRSEAHKRLMLLATVSLLPPAISRWPIAVDRPAVIAAVIIAFLAAAALHDVVGRRRVHPVSLWGGLTVLVSIPLRFAISQSEAWHRAARWLIG